MKYGCTACTSVIEQLESRIRELLEENADLKSTMAKLGGKPKPKSKLRVPGVKSVAKAITELKLSGRVKIMLLVDETGWIVQRATEVGHVGFAYRSFGCKERRDVEGGLIPSYTTLELAQRLVENIKHQIAITTEILDA